VRTRYDGIGMFIYCIHSLIVCYFFYLTALQSIVHGARRAQRGVRKVQDGAIAKSMKKGEVTSSKKSTNLKLSYIRRNEMMLVPASGTRKTQIFSAGEGPKDTRTRQEKENLLTWANEYLESHPYIPPEELERRAKAKAAEVESKKNVDSTVVDYVRSTSEQVAGLTTMFSMFVQRVLPTPSLPSLGAPSTSSLTEPSDLPGSLLDRAMFTGGSGTSSTPSLLPGPNNLCGNPQSPDTVLRLPTSTTSTATSSASFTPTPTASSAPTPTDSSDDKYHAISLSHGRILTFKYSQIPDPPSISFVADIPRLNCIWDDEKPSFDAEECSKISAINGTPVALRYWPDLYRNKKDLRWKGIKSSWVEWKYMVERYRSSSPEAFWAEFSNDHGQHLPWKTISQRLRDQRAVRDQELVDRAKAEYGERFSQVFSNRSKLMVDNSAIAHRYLELQTAMNIDHA
jgi:hypothetical protein